MKYGLIGEKLGHSFSKEIHEQIATYQYELKEVSKQDFDDFMLKRDFVAINVTIPYKEKVIPYLYYIDDNAKYIGAVNTIVNIDGKLYGYNTDYLGLKSLIEKNDIVIKDKKVLVLGTGGTSKTSNAVLKTLGAKSITFVSINNEPNTITYEEAINSYQDTEVIINTTPCGMYPNVDNLIIDINKFDKLEAVCDVIYNPLLTPLLKNARQRKIKYAGGLYMLVAQAVYACGIFTNSNIDTSVIDTVYSKLKFSKQNIVLVGMPGCGKTTIGKNLAKTLNKTFVDTDVLIEEYLKMPIKDYLTPENEEEFRTIESNIIASVSKRNNQIISTGGGAITKEININSFLSNGIIVFIDRDLQELEVSDNRPLSSNYEKLKALYEKRYHLYVKNADVIVKNNTTVDEVVDRIVKEVTK